MISTAHVTVTSRVRMFTGFLKVLRKDFNGRKFRGIDPWVSDYQVVCCYLCSLNRRYVHSFLVFLF